MYGLSNEKLNYMATDADQKLCTMAAVNAVSALPLKAADLASVGLSLADLWLYG